MEERRKGERRDEEMRRKVTKAGEQVTPLCFFFTCPTLASSRCTSRRAPHASIDARAIFLRWIGKQLGTVHPRF